MKEKVPPTASNRRKRELDREDPKDPKFGDLVTYKIKRKNVETTTVVPPNTVEEYPTNTVEQSPQNTAKTTNEGAFKHRGAHIEDDGDVNINSVGENCEDSSKRNSVGEAVANNDEVGPIDSSLLRSFKFHKARSIALGQGFKALKAGGTGISLSLKKLRNHYAYKLEKVLSDGTATKAKMKGLTTKSVDRAYMLYILGSFLFPTKKGTDTTICLVTIDLAADDDDEMFGIHQKNQAPQSNEDGDTPVDNYEAGSEQYHASASECNLLRESIDQMKEDMQLKRILDEQCALTYADLPAQLDVKRKKLINAKEMKKSLEVNNNEWEVWRQSLKKALTSKGMGDMGDPTFKELFGQNERFFIIAQQGSKGDYQEDLVSTAVTLKNVIIARREKMAKKKKLQELLFQPWTKYLVDICGVEINDNNSGFRVTAAI
ncbi:hypothetical protein GIB67_018992 [Kingdonia uniflora]|uniref:Uncharacterized protein n=1 Tax=Kingdonia uniflora TaxID=39325 RepID=A0A7J7MH01_9MAGN|nr:hypothetical protein GIB67_018992 [Kingdonia uniflora]